MKNKVKTLYRDEKGAASLLVFITIMTFVVILLGAYLTVTTMRKSRITKQYKDTANIWRRCK